MLKSKIRRNLVSTKIYTVLVAVIALTQPEKALAATSSCDNTTSPADLQNCLQQSPIVHDINLVVNFLSGGVGIVVVGVIILGGVQYAAAGDNPNALTAARQRITNGLIALVAFLFLFAFVQWLIPGGVFK